MKLGPVTKLDNRNKTVSKKLTMMSYRKIVTPLPFWSNPEAGFRTHSL